MIPRPKLEDITEADIQRLIDHGVREGRTLDFKIAAELSKENRQGLAEDVCAFANTIGGDLVIGLEPFDKREGDSAAAKAIDPVHVPNLDATLLDLVSSLRDSLEPRLATLHAHPVPLAVGGHVIVLRVGASPSAPHRVVRDRGGHFFLRNSVGKERMDIHAIRTAFAFADSLAERALAWREQRLAAIRGLLAPRMLRGGPLFVVQLLPLRSLTHRGAQPTAALKAAGGLLRDSRPCGHVLQTVEVNYEGVVCATHASGSGMEQPSAYAQVFRDGSLELAGVADIKQIGRPPINAIIPVQYEVPLVESGLPSMFRALAALDTPAPAYLFVALLNVWNKRIGFKDPDSGGADSREIPPHLKELLCAPVYVEDFGTPPRELAREALAPLWHAIGMESSQTRLGGSLL